MPFTEQALLRESQRAHKSHTPRHIATAMLSIRACSSFFATGTPLFFAIERRLPRRQRQQTMLFATIIVRHIVPKTVAATAPARAAVAAITPVSAADCHAEAYFFRYDTLQQFSTATFTPARHSASATRILPLMPRAMPPNTFTTSIFRHAARPHAPTVGTPVLIETVDNAVDAAIFCAILFISAAAPTRSTKDTAAAALFISFARNTPRRRRDSVFFAFFFFFAPHACHAATPRYRCR